MIFDKKTKLMAELNAAVLSSWKSTRNDYATEAIIKIPDAVKITFFNNKTLRYNKLKRQGDTFTTFGIGNIQRSDVYCERIFAEMTKVKK
jgi:hypothetical protein